jgi:predicted permease
VNDFTKRELAIIVAVIIIATAFMFALTWFLLQVFFPPDPRDPLTKAGGLKPTQDIRKAR